jgi:uncharacterized protein YqeY
MNRLCGPSRGFSTTIAERIDKEVVAAMRAKDSVRLSVLRLCIFFLFPCFRHRVCSRNVKSRITYKLKEANAPKSLDDGAVALLIKQGLSDVEKTIAEVGGIDSDNARKMVANALQEKTILNEFLPAQATETDVRAAIGAAIVKHNATSVKQMRVVLADVAAQFDGSKFDPKLLGSIVKQMIEKKD